MDAFSYQTWFVVRYIHVASAALLVGGAFATCGFSLSTAGFSDATAVRAAAALYERAFWFIVGLSVATGISNLGLKGDGLLGPTTSWGIALSLKLAAVLFLLLLSLVRSDFIVRSRATPASDFRRERIVLAMMYGATAALLLAILWTGLGLAHGRY